MEAGPFGYPSRARRYAPVLGLALLASVAALSSSLATAAPAAPGACPPPPAAPAPGGGASSPPAIARGIPAPAEVILACVGSTPITGATFDHWAAVARRSAAPEHAGGHHSKSPPVPVGETISEVMGFLVSGDWVIDEGAQLGISPSEATVRQQFDRIRREQFPHRRDFRAFLRGSGQTVADLLLRVRLNILSTAIMRHVTQSATGTKAKGRALSEFVKGFKARWQAQTVCLPSFAVPDCGSTQEPL
jgi:hypothetical protein